MKTIPALFTACLAIASAQQSPEEGSGVITWIPAAKVEKFAPLFFSATSSVVSKISLKEVDSRFGLSFKVLQGKPEKLTLSLHGDGEIRSVTGDNLKDWSVRTDADGERFLELHPTTVEGVESFTVQVHAHATVKSGSELPLLLLGAGSASGYRADVFLQPSDEVDLKILKVDGLVPVEGGNHRRFQSTTAPLLVLSISRAGTAPRELEIGNANLTGTLAEDGKSMGFILSGEVRSAKSGAVADLFRGAIAMTGETSGDGWHIRLQREGKGFVHELVAEREGTFPIALAFSAPVERSGDWRVLDLAVPAGVVTPLRLVGIEREVTFDRTRLVAPELAANHWQGFLPANGKLNLAWKPSRVEAEGALFFSSTETTEVRVGSGLLRQNSSLEFTVLQGKLNALKVKLDGPGEVLSVEGSQVLGWNVVEDAGSRRLEITLNQAIEGTSDLRIEAQSALGPFPVNALPLRITPEGTLRHSGWVRVAGQGSVKLEVTNLVGMMQLSPNQFPVQTKEALRQVSVYRFPAAERAFEISANQVLPEIGVHEVTIYEIGETDRRILATLELDIREAPLREWEVGVPEEFAVAAVNGAAVADFTVAGTAANGQRIVKILFNQAVDGRQLVTLRLEKNEAAKAGSWDLPSLSFPGAKSRRGFIGVIAAPGFRATPGQSSALAEVPLTFFPRQTPGLQQAFRLREAKWSASIKVEALGQNIQADVFHLYSLKAGAAYGSVLMNYFVVGAPATEWRIAIPEGIGNLDVTGQNVGRDWRREGNVVIVPLSRPVMGAGTVLLSFEQPMSARGGVISPGEVRPLNVGSERGYVQVVSPLQVNYSVSRSEGPLLKLEANELPAEYRLLTSAPTLGAWQYTSRDFAIDLDVKWFATGETADQIVDFLKLSSQIARDGQIITDARFFVKSRGRDTLRLTLPVGSTLWETRVDGVPENARQDGSDLLVPLPPKADPNEPVEISMRYGSQAARPSSPELSAPTLEAPVVLGEWLISGDENRRLIPKGGNAEVVRPVIEPNGFQRVSQLAGKPVALIVVLALATLVLGRRAAGRWQTGMALLSGLAMVAACLGAAVVVGGSPFTPPPLEYAAPVVAAGEQVTLKIANVPPWRAQVGWTGLALIVLGVGLIAAQTLRKIRGLAVLGSVLIGMGLLAQRGGAPWAFLFLACGVAILWVAPLIRRLGLRVPRRAASATALLMLFVCLAPTSLKAEEDRVAESMVQDWRIDDGKLQGGVELVVRGKAGDRFLLLRSPAVLTRFEGEGLRVTKGPLGDREAYFVVMDREGRVGGRADFEMPLVRPQEGFALPTGPATLQRVSVRWSEAGWEIASPAAVASEAIAGLPESESGATLILRPVADIAIHVQPRQRDVGAEAVRFFSEVSNLFIPGPGVVNGRHRIVIRPTQGRVSELVMKVPEAFTVGEISEGPVESWRFDPATRDLRVAIEPSQHAEFTLTVETQRGSEALPMELALAPLRVVGSAGETGLLGLAFGEEAQPEATNPKGLSVINLEDFGGALIPKDQEGKPQALLQRVFRYGQEDATLSLRVAPVAPEMRVETRQVLSLSEDRLVIAHDLAVSITRAGVFKVVLEVPEGLEIEGVTGQALSHWTEAKEEGRRLVTLHLNGRTLGLQAFSLSLAGPPPGAQSAWEVPRIVVREASRETGTLIVVPERGFQTRAVTRDKVSQLDPRELGDEPSAREATRPGALAFRLLQADWKLAMAVERLDPWVTAQVLHDVTLREGQTMNRISLRYRIENAAVKALRFTIPGLDEAATGTVRASGSGVSDLVPVEGSPGVWEIRFQRGIAGDTAVDLEYQSPTAGSGTEAVHPIGLNQVRQITYFLAVRAGGRLQLDAKSPPRGWERADWAVVQTAMPHLSGVPAPGLAFRVAEAEAPLAIAVKRHDLASSLKLRVESGELTTLLSPKGDALTAVDLLMPVSEKSTLRLKLPKDSQLFNVLVNDEGAPLVREGNDWLFYVFPEPEGGRPASVRFVYSTRFGEELKLEGPSLDVPLENLTWKVLIPDGWRLTGHEGDFDLKGALSSGRFRLEEYQSYVARKRETDAREAVALLDQANAWLAQGEQEKAGQALGKAARANRLDLASNEDARVQLRQLKTQQAVLGLTTRRQKLYLDNSGDVSQAENVQLEGAARDNPIIRGDLNYNPNTYDRLMAGNTADENSALKAIANRIVAQQLAAEPAPATLDVTISQRGTVMTFQRSVQVNGSKPMTLQLELEPIRQRGYGLGLIMCGTLAVLIWRRPGTDTKEASAV
jgi:hypothetical protein